MTKICPLDCNDFQYTGQCQHTYTPGGEKLSYQTGMKDGRAQALNEAIASVEKLRPPKNLHPLVNKTEVLAQVLKALAALKEKAEA